MGSDILTPAVRDDLASGALVHVWHIALRPADPSGDAPADLALLDGAELRRAGQFLRPEPRTCFVQCRAALRRLLGGYLNREPAALAIGASEFGKPYLTDATDGSLCFNVAHSGAHALVALSRGRQVGVDLEQVRQDFDFEGIARNEFAREEHEALARVAPTARRDAFFALWSRKEAYLKALGSGLTTPLDSFFIVAPDPPAPGRIHRVGETEAPSDWTLHDIPLPRGYHGALVVEGVVPAPRMLSYPSSA